MLVEYFPFDLYDKALSDPTKSTNQQLVPRRELMLKMLSYWA
jgi:hypothetical protein